MSTTISRTNPTARYTRQPYNYTALCCEFGANVCVRLDRFNICRKRMDTFVNKRPPMFTSIVYDRFLSGISHLEHNMHDKLRMKLEDYMNCTIEYLDEKKPCKMDNVMGSFYPNDVLPSYCYTLYSLWGSPDKKREQIPKGAKMLFEFDLRASGRHEPVTFQDETGYHPKHNLPTNPSVQIAIHSPYFLPSPYITGRNYQGGKAYQLRILMEETHLLSSPYQTNCTDYMKMWRSNGGKGPVSQMEVVQECRARRYNEQSACVPVRVDYPHTHSICGTLQGDNDTNINQECMTLGDTYNQPCDSMFYTTDSQEVEVEIVMPVVSHELFAEKAIRKKIKEHDCTKKKSWNPECSRISIGILYDRFEITNITAYPKFESVELFSAIGGNMGMWLGISLVAVYDFIFTVVGLMKTWMVRRQKILPGKKVRFFYGTEAKKQYWQSDDSQKKLYDYY